MLLDTTEAASGLAMVTGQPHTSVADIKKEPSQSLSPTMLRGAREGLKYKGRAGWTAGLQQLSQPPHIDIRATHASTHSPTTPTMQFKTLAFAALALFVPSALGVTLSYDETYDNGSNSLASVACSDGAHGLLTKGFSTFGSLPHFPNIGGAAAVSGWNSAQCGTCWQLSYNGKSINVLAVDHADSGFNIALGAMNALTNGQAKQLGRINVSSKQVAASQCGL
ncbi:Cerato-platanin-domain-containing protein [Trametes gibbosa]|nr:Cerato-platanin-domain-containing protein [Trametes gibbosa]